MSKQKVEEPIEKITDAAAQAARAESEPAPVRHYRSKLFRFSLVIVAATFAVLTFLVKTVPTFSIDLQITRSIQLIKFPFFASLMSMISWPGFPPQSMIVPALVILLIYFFGFHWEAVMALIASITSGVIVTLVKDWIQRPRPLPSQVSVFSLLNSYSFPSGHVMYYLVFFGFVAFLAYSLLKPSMMRSLVLIFIGALIALIGVSRVYLGEHWASDVLGSYLLGSLTLVALIQLYIWGKTRFFVHQPVAATKPQQTKKAASTTHAEMKR